MPKGTFAKQLQAGVATPTPNEARIAIAVVTGEEVERSIIPLLEPNRARRVLPGVTTPEAPARLSRPDRGGRARREHPMLQHSASQAIVLGT